MKIFVAGTGAVSPAGWGMGAFRKALDEGAPLSASDLPRPGWSKPLAIRKVPAPSPRPAFMAHARLRRTSPITQYATAAALEALGDDAAKVAAGEIKLGVVLTVMSGCVNYSRRFYDEALRDPATASPLVFPETVFNAPASHIAALIGTTAVNYTLIGDPGTYVQGIELAADWLSDGVVDACIVIGAEESDWITADAFHLFSQDIVMGDGAGALYLKGESAASLATELKGITNAALYTAREPRAAAARRMGEELTNMGKAELLCDGITGVKRVDAAEDGAWNDWKGARLSPKRILGEGLMASAAWQCVAAVDALKQSRYGSAHVSVVGCNQQAIGAYFEQDR